MDILTIAVFAGTFALLVAAYAAWQGLARAFDRVQREADARGFRSLDNGGHYVGGSDKPGSN